jgi:hypothetical protein
MLPVASAVQNVVTLPSKVKAMVLDGVKPLPLIAAPLPAGPALGIRLMTRMTVPAPALGIRLRAGLTAKVALPVYVPSDTVTVWMPAVVAGTVNVQLLPASR